MLVHFDAFFSLSNLLATEIFHWILEEYGRLRVETCSSFIVASLEVAVSSFFVMQGLLSRWICWRDHYEIS